MENNTGQIDLNTGKTPRERKIKRSRNGCFTCKQRRRKCDEAKPYCMSCVNTGRQCGGYGVRLIFDVDDSRKLTTSINSKGEKKHGFRGRPKSKEAFILNEKVLQPDHQIKVSMGILKGSDNKGNNNNLQIKKEDSNSFSIDALSTAGYRNSHQNNGVQNEPNGAAPSSISLKTISKELNSNGLTRPDTMMNIVPSPSTIMSTNTVMSNPDTVMSNNTVSSSDKDFELDFNDEQEIEHAFLSGLDYILDNYDNELLNTVDSQFPAELVASPLHTFANLATSPLMHNNTEANSPQAMMNGDYELELDSSNLGPQLKKKEESHILKHFFEKVIYLLDAHPQNPWPQLMMKFGSMELAKSCFLSLSSMHLYVNNGGDEFYKKGLLHINNTMEYLIKYVKSSGIQKTGETPGPGDDNQDNTENPDKNENENNELGLSVPNIISKIKSESNKKKGTNFMVILLLLYVHLLFAVLESGRSALARMFLKLSASIASDPMFNKKIKKIKQSQPLLCVLSWFDTVSALVSPDCRIPFCDPKWFGESTDIISTDKMNGCPVGMFRVLYDLSLYRRDIMLLFDGKHATLDDIKIMHKSLLDLRDRCLHYRDHVLYVLPHGSNFSYIDRLKCAQMWSLAGILLTIQLELHYFKKLNNWSEQNRNLISESELPESVPSVHIYSEKATAIVTEFLSVYNTIPSESPVITQMVWPIFYVSICSSTPENRSQSWQCLKTLYETVKMGTIRTNMDIVQRIWQEGCSLESILAGEGWFENGIDLLPC